MRTAAVSEEGRELLALGRFVAPLESEGFGALAGLAPDPREAPSPRRKDAAVEAKKKLREAKQLLRELERSARQADERAAKLADQSAAAADRSDTMTTAAASEERARLLDQLQVETDEGPCLDAIKTGNRVVVAAFGQDRRYPSFGAVAREKQRIGRFSATGTPPCASRRRTPTAAGR